MLTPLFTANEVAARLRVSRKHVYVLVQRGQLEGLRMGRQWRFKLEHVEAYEASLAAA